MAVSNEISGVQEQNIECASVQFGQVCTSSVHIQDFAIILFVLNSNKKVVIVVKNGGVSPFWNTLEY